MTLFGKIVFGLTALVVAVGIFYGTSSYVKNEAEVVTQIQTSTTTDSVASATSTTETASSTEEKKIAFPLVLERGGMYKCSVTQSMGTITSDGTVYINGPLVRAEFSMSVADQKISTTMIARDGYMYSWTASASSTGTKVKMATANDPKQPTGVKTWNGSQVTDYSCDEWKPDEVLFEIPKTVTFTEAR
jgi:outer membrane lipoprotein-sorting protein